MKGFSFQLFASREHSPRPFIGAVLGLLALWVAPLPGEAADAGGTIQNLGNGSYSGTGGTLTLTGSLSAGNGAVVFTGGTLVLDGTFSLLTNVTFPTSGTLVLTGTLTTPTGSTTIPGGSFSLGGTLTSSNDTSGYLGGIALTSGLLTLNGNAIYHPQIGASLGQPFVLLKCASVSAGTTPTVCSIAELPPGLTIDPNSGVVSGVPVIPGVFRFDRVTQNDKIRFTEPFELTVSPPAFLEGQTSLGNGVYYAAFPDGGSFGEYSFLADPRYIYSWDLSSYEFLVDAGDGGGIYLYDFTSGEWFYTSPSYSYPYVYDFERGAVLYYYRGTSNPRYFFDFGTHRIITE